MKIHISRTYNVPESDSVFHINGFLAECGSELGFHEISISRFPIGTDTPSELDRRMDGILAGVSEGDICILQLPTGNGAAYEKTLMKKIRAIPNTRIALFLQDRLDETEKKLIQDADVVAVSKPVLQEELASPDIPKEEILVCAVTEYSDAVEAKGALLECINPLIQEAYQNRQDDPDAVQVCFCIHDGTGEYCSFTASAMWSIELSTQRKIRYHIFTDSSVTKLSRRRLRDVAAKGGDTVKFYDINPDNFPFSQQKLKTYTVGSLFRLCIPDLLPDCGKILYLDSDLLFHADIGELWDTDLQGNLIGAVHDTGYEHHVGPLLPIRDGEIRGEEYFNSGVLLMDLDGIRKSGNLLASALIYLLKHPDSITPDQDALNSIFKKKTLILPAKWNVLTKYERHEHPELRDEVYHYAGEKWLKAAFLTQFDEYYASVRADTPWKNSISLEDFSKEGIAMEKHLAFFQELVEKIRASDRKIIFYGINMLSMHTLCSIFKPQGDDYFICPDPIDKDGKRYGQPVKTFDDLKNEKKGTYLVIVLPEADNGTAIQKLDSLGLKYGEDYFPAPMITDVEQGGYLF